MMDHVASDAYGLMSYVNRALIVIVVETYSTRISGTTAVIEESPKRKFEEPMKGFTIIQKLIGLV